VTKLFDVLSQDPKRLIDHFDETNTVTATTSERRVCDYIAGMTDPYAEKIYRRLFVPGFGSSRDEL
jgi:dGTPase